MTEIAQQSINMTFKSPFGQSNPEKSQYSLRQSQNQHQIQQFRQPSVKSITENINAEQLLKFFEKYSPFSDIKIEQIHKSQSLKLKRYKQCIYYGQFLNGKRHGKGIMVYHNGRIYEGQWESDFKHGKGFQKFINNSKYDGFYVNGKPEGVGTYVWPNGQLYQGQWINGLKHGSGMWRGARGDSYIGEWKFGRADGYGVHTWVNGDRYEGQFKACLKHGQGTEKFANGDIYIGSYINGKPSGYGQYYWSNGSFFKGSFKNGLRHGNGVWKRGPGQNDKYQGQYANDKKCGYGIFTWASGNVYKGNYFDDIRHGYGEMYWNDDSCYKGMWQKGIQHGEGEITLPGQSPKKGIFEENVLISILNEQIQNPPKNLNQDNQNNQQDIRQQQYQRNQGYKHKFGNSKIDKITQKSNSINPNKFNHTKEIESYQSYNNSHILAQPQNRISSRPYQNPIIGQNTMIRPYPNISTSSNKQKIPHSSFYLHQINKNQRPYTRDVVTTKINRQGLSMSITDQGNNKYRARRIQTGVVQRGNRRQGQDNHEMREFVQVKINGNKSISKSYK